jgi:SpoVK/Ycf46/Vps4 family AAA+-type ATPase
LASVVKEAMLTAYSEDRELEVQDLILGLDAVPPAALKDVVAEIPSVRWEEIGGYEMVKAALR